MAKKIIIIKQNANKCKSLGESFIGHRANNTSAEDRKKKNASQQKKYPDILF